MSEILELVSAALESSLSASIVAMPVIAVVLLVDVVFGRRVPANYRALLWCVVVCRLLMPPDTIAPASRFSVQQHTWAALHDVLSDDVESVGRGYPFYDAQRLKPITCRMLDGQTLTVHLDQNKAKLDTFTYQDADGEYSTVGINTKTAEEVPFSKTNVVAATLSPVSGFGEEHQARFWTTENLLEACAITWLIVAVAMLLRASVASIRFARKIAKVAETEDQALIDHLLRACDRLRVGLRPRLKIVPKIAGPLVFGFWRPTLCLPLEQLDGLTEKQLELIMLHEVAHICRRDALLAWLLTIVRAVHWYNPCAWLTAAKISQYSELACDQLVISSRPDDRQTYAEVLIRFSSRPTPQLGLQGLWFSGRRRQMASRVKGVLTMPASRSVWQTLLSITLLGAVAYAGLTEPKIPIHVPPEDVPNLTTPWVFSPQVVKQRESAEILEKEYDVATANSAVTQFDTSYAEDAPDVWLSLVLAPYGFPTTISPQGDPQPVQIPLAIPRSVTAATVHGMPAGHWDRDGLKIKLRTSSEGHDRFEKQLHNIEQVGIWQVRVQTRILRTRNLIASTVGIDWESAAHVELDSDHVDYIVATPAIDRDLPVFDDAGAISVRAETTTQAFAPHLAKTIDAHATRQLIEACQSDTRTNLMQAASVVQFSSNVIGIRNEVHRPFVVGVSQIRGEYATAHQPQIAVLSEGQRIRIRPTVRPDGLLDMVCEINESSISDVDTLELPGGKYGEDGNVIESLSLQSASANSRAVSVACRIAEGESLVVASPTKGRDGEATVTMYLITPSWFQTQREMAR